MDSAPSVDAMRYLATASLSSRAEGDKVRFICTLICCMTGYKRQKRNTTNIRAHRLMTEPRGAIFVTPMKAALTTTENDF